MLQFQANNAQVVTLRDQDSSELQLARSAVRRGRLALSAAAGALASASLFAAPAQAQLLPPAPSSLVSVCTGVSLPRSTVTEIMDDVVLGIYGPIESNINATLGVLRLPPLSLAGLPTNLGVNVTGLLSDAASGAPITLQAIATDGTLVGPSSQCDAAADSYTLDTPAGIAIGGNRITGLGATGQEASAGEIDSIAIGNRASTNAAATGSIAIGPGATVGAGGSGSLALGSGASALVANSVALGAGSVAGRDPPIGAVGEVSVGAPGAERQITNVAAGTSLTDAVNLGQLQAVAATVPINAVEYDDASNAVVTLQGAAGTTITNLAPGAVTATSSDAVNGAQLHATNGAVAGAQTTADDALALGQNSVQYDDSTHTSVTYNPGGTAVTVHNVAAGTVATDAVNLGQLQAVAALVPINAMQYDDATNAVATLQGAAGTTITNLAPGAVTATSSDAVNGSQLFATEQLVTANTTAITNLAVSIGNGAIGPVQYSNGATPTVPNGGVPTNHVTLVGAGPGAVGLHNVADGLIAAGSTDAVNGGQIAALSLAVDNAVVYGVNPDGTRNNSVTLVGGNAGAPVTISGLAPGQLSPTSTQAVNGAQLNATNVAVTAAQTTADGALALGQNSVQYNNAAHTAVTYNPGGAAVTVHNVAAGTAATDAVNVGQMGSAINQGVGLANQYTDSRIEALSFDLSSTEQSGRAGTSAALAAAGLPQAIGAGRTMVAGGVGHYRGRSAFAIGASHVLDGGSAVFKAGVTYDSSQKVGANAGVGFQF